MRFILAAILPALLFAACLPEPKTGCDTTDNCAPGRVCVAGTCQPARRDAGLDARSDRMSSGDVAIDLAETLNPYFAGGPDGVPDRVAPDAPATIDAPGSPAGPDASPDRQSSVDVATNLSGILSPDLAADVDGVPDSAPQAVGAALDVPAFIDASGDLAGLDAGADNQATGDMLSPDLAGNQGGPLDLAAPAVDAAPDAPPILTIDAAPAVDAALDAPPILTIDAAPDLDVPQSGIDTGSADCDRPGDLPPAPVSWEDFLARSPREPWSGGRFIVDGDLALDEAGLRRYYNAWFVAAGVPPKNLAPMGATASWPFPDSFFLSYCISTSFGDNLAAVEASMRAATASWSDRVGVQYTYVPEENAICNADNANVTFDVGPVSDAGYAAVAFFPDSPRSARSLLIDTSAFAADAGGADLEAVLSHQLGHILGFQHEHLWLDPACTTEDSRLAVQIANYDIDSVMHLPTCRPSELGGVVQTEGDFAGAMAIYGLSPALTGTITM